MKYNRKTKLDYGCICRWCHHESAIYSRNGCEFICNCLRCRDGNRYVYWRWVKAKRDRYLRKHGKKQKPFYMKSLAHWHFYKHDLPF